MYGDGPMIDLCSMNDNDHFNHEDEYDEQDN